MTDPYEQMGQYFLNLWQQQVTRMSHDPNFLQSMLDMMQRGGQSGGQPSPAYGSYGTSTTAAHSPATASEPDARAQRDLVRRLEECEKRLAFLERGYAALSGSPFLGDELPPKRGPVS